MSATAEKTGSDEAKESSKKNGVIERFVTHRGYGFIESDGKKYFVHHSQIKTRYSKFKKLVEGDKVEFEIGNYNGKECAINVLQINNFNFLLVVQN
jgi:cold shock CspA family protein